jgi:hypothetical protein
MAPQLSFSAYKETNMRKGSRRNSPKPAEVVEDEVTEVEETEESPGNDDNDTINVKSSSITVNELAPAKIESPWRRRTAISVDFDNGTSLTISADTRARIEISG